MKSFATAILIKKIIFKGRIAADSKLPDMALTGRGGDNDCKNDNKDENEGDNDNDGGGMRVTMKMGTVAMDAWAKSQQRPPFWFGGAG